MAVSMDQVKTLRDMTGAGMMDCKNALTETDGDLEKAVVLLRERGIAKAAKRVGRETANGVVEAYLHRTAGDYPPQVGALVELDCESDFVAKGDDFRTLARELALHVAGANPPPRWISSEDVPAEIIEAERELYGRRYEQEGKPAQAIPKIVEGQVNAFYRDHCLMSQAWIKDPKVSIGDMVKESISKLQENIVVRRFARFDVRGE